MKKRKRYIAALITTTLIFLCLFSFYKAKRPQHDLDFSRRKRLLIGILTTPQTFERRGVIRVTYKQLPSPDVDLYFVVCRPHTKELETLVLTEKLTYNDMLVLDCKENMNKGKTFTYFSTVARMFPNGEYSYVMKADDDSWLGLQNLGQAIQKLPSRGLCYGRSNGDYHLGMGYMASWDIIYWISTHDEQVKKHLDGPEDRMFFKWTQMSGLVEHYISNNVAFYDAPGGEPPACKPHEKDCAGGWVKDYNPDTQVIHLLKDTRFFFEAADYFLKEELATVPLISSKGHL